MPAQLTADCFARLRLRWGTEPGPGELPAAIEHMFDAGHMVDHYLVTPTAKLWAVPGLPLQNEVSGLLFCLPAAGSDMRQVLLLRPDDRTPAEAVMPEAEFQKLLAENGIILPGEPGFVPPRYRQGVNA